MFSSAPLSTAQLWSSLASTLSIQWIVIDCSMVCLGWEYQQKIIHKIWWKLSPYRKTSCYKHSISSQQNGGDEIEFTSYPSFWHVKCISLRACGLSWTAEQRERKGKAENICDAECCISFQCIPFFSVYPNGKDTMKFIKATLEIHASHPNLLCQSSCEIKGSKTKPN